MKQKNYFWCMVTVIMVVVQLSLMVSCSKDDKEDAMLEVSPENLQISDSGEGTLTITSNTKWEVSTTADWLTFSTMSGMGNGQVTIRASGYSMSDRMAILTIKGEGISRQTLVTQKGVVIEKDGILHVNVFKAGVFPDLIEGRKTSTTRMKLSGKINGTDVVSLQDMMTTSKGGKLSYLDMSDAFIVEGGEPYKVYSSKSRNLAGREDLTTQNNIISESMFEDCDVIQELILPNSVVKISHYMFGYTFSSNIHTITIGQSTIGGVDHDDLDVRESLGALQWMDKLEDIKVHPDNQKYCAENGVLYNKDKTVLYVIPQKFQRTLLLPGSLITIGQAAFLHYNASSIKLPSSVRKLKSNAFWGSSIESIDVSNVDEMEEGVFYYCDKLQTVNLSKSLTIIPNATFTGCSALESIIIPNSVTELGDYSFSDCIILPSIRIPQSVRTIGKGVFLRCYNLNEIYMDSPTPPTFSSEIRNSYDIFGSNYKSISIYVPKGSKERYTSTFPWSELNIVEIAY